MFDTPDTFNFVILGTLKIHLKYSKHAGNMNITLDNTRGDGERCVKHEMIDSTNIRIQIKDCVACIDLFTPILIAYRAMFNTMQ